MIWQLVNDNLGIIGETIISRAGKSTNTTSNATINNSNNTSFTNTTVEVNNTTNNNSSSTVNTNATNNTTGSSNSTTTDNSTTNSNNAKVNSSYELSMFYCGFGKDFCGQSTTDDVSPKASIVILAFANILTNGSIEVDSANFPSSLQYYWKINNKKVLISIGGQNVDWSVAFTTT